MGYGTTDRVLWSDRKRYYGLPLSFEIYEASEDRLFLTDGFLHRQSREIQLHRVRDISYKRSISQLIFGVGTVTVTTSDNKTLDLENIKHPLQVKELLYRTSEEQKRVRRYRYREFPPYQWDAYDGLDS